ncbi:MAG: ADP-ribosylglycohydrolase family protein [Myxococcales bacterium]|nr:ADP-ribosylglycohydrolase family protein [Myxococcales bacterium]
MTGSWPRRFFAEVAACTGIPPQPAAVPVLVGLDHRDKFGGALLGTALGDAFGAPLEGASGSRLSSLVARRADAPDRWRPTDDTQMMLDVAAWLLLPSEDPEALLAQLAEGYDAALGYGHGTKQVLHAYRSGRPWGACPFTTWPEGSKGNGSSARIAPVACRFLNEPLRAEQVAHMSSWVTHAHPDATAGATLQMHAVRLALGTAPEDFDGPAFLDQLATVTGELAGWPCGALARIGALVGCGATAAEVRKQFEVARPLAETTVPVALWAFVAGAPAFEERVGLAASVGGDVDTVCAMTGALAGALLGTRGLPANWLVRLAPRYVERMEGLADQLYSELDAT